MGPAASVLLNRLLARARLRHLQVLVQVADLQSFKRAGEAVGLTQPAVTYVIGDLERLLGVALFHRHARGVTATAVAGDLLPVARRMLQTLGQGAEAVAARQRHSDGMVRLAATSSALGDLLSRGVPAFAAAHPQVQLHVLHAEADRFGDLIARGEVDLVACRQPDVTPAGWAFRRLADDRLAVVCAPQHPLAGQRRVTLAALADQTWLVPPVDSLARRAIESLATEEGWALRLSPVVTRALPLTWAMLQRQPLLSLLPASVVGPLVAAGQLATLNVEHAWPVDGLGLLHPVQGGGDAAERFADHLAADAALRAPARTARGARPADAPAARRTTGRPRRSAGR